MFLHSAGHSGSVALDHRLTYMNSSFDAFIFFFLKLCVVLGLRRSQLRSGLRLCGSTFDPCEVKTTQIFRLSGWSQKRRRLTPIISSLSVKVVLAMSMIPLWAIDWRPVSTRRIPAVLETTTATQPHDHCCTPIRPLLHNHTTTATRPLLHDHTTTARRQYDHCYTTIRPLLHDHTTTATRPQLHNRCCVTTRPLLHDHCYTTTRPKLHDHTTKATRPLLHDHTTTATRPHDRCYTTTATWPYDHCYTSTRPLLWVTIYII